MNNAIAKIFGYLVAIISVLVYASLFYYAFSGASPSVTMTGDVYLDVGLMLVAYILVIGFVCTVIAIREHLARIEYMLTALAHSRQEDEHQEDEKTSEPFQ